MNRRVVGIGFMFISAWLYITRFITAAIYGSGLSGSWNADLFKALLKYVDQGLTPLSILALVLGIIYLLWAEISERKRIGS